MGLKTYPFPGRFDRVPKPRPEVLEATEFLQRHSRELEESALGRRSLPALAQVSPWTRLSMVLVSIQVLYAYYFWKYPVSFCF